MRATRESLWGLLAALALGTLPGWSATKPATTAKAEESAPVYFAARLTDDARGALRNTRITPGAAAQEASILLQFATRLDPANLRSLKLLAETARAAEQRDIEKNALRQLIVKDPGDLVSQVAYLDLLAGQTQLLEERARIYQAALNQARLDPQIRSEMALRMAQIATARGDRTQQKQYLDQALSLNDLNVGALRARVGWAAGSDARGGAATVERLEALVRLLNADPYETDAWAELAKICAAANIHDRAAEYLITTFEQTILRGAPPSGELLLDLAIEEASAGRRAEAAARASSLANLADAPLTAMLLADYLGSARGAAAASAPNPAPAPPPAPGASAPAAPASQPEPLAIRIERAFGQLTKSGDAAALADAAGASLTLLHEPLPDTAKWIDAYAALVAPEDATLARLRGWQLYRQNKLDEAREALLKLADSDPLAQIGLARIAIDQNRKTDAAKYLEDIWSSHPTGLLAVQVAETAQRGGLTLADTQWTRQLRDIVSKLPASAATAHRSPRDVELVSAEIKKISVGALDPMLLNVRLTNASQRAQPVGPEGVINSTLGLAVLFRDPKPPHDLGLYAVEDLQRVYRLEPRGTIEATIRIDQGEVADIFEHNVVKAFTVGVSVATAPRMGPGKQLLTGLGGQLIQAGDVKRPVLFMASPRNFEVFIGDLTKLTGGRQLLQVSAAESLLASVLHPEVVFKDDLAKRANAADARQKLIDALLPLARSPEALIRAAWIRELPAESISEAMDKAADSLGADPDPLVRLLWAQRQAELAAQPGDAGASALEALKQHAEAEKDPTVQSWMRIMQDQAKAPATAATTTPATSPAATTIPASTTQPAP